MRKVAVIGVGMTKFGKFPVNPSGGLLCKGHPIGATGVAQIAELLWQLRGEGFPCKSRERKSDWHTAPGVSSPRIQGHPR